MQPLIRSNRLSPFDPASLWQWAAFVDPASDVMPASILGNRYPDATTPITAIYLTRRMTTDHEKSWRRSLAAKGWKITEGRQDGYWRLARKAGDRIDVATIYPAGLWFPEKVDPRDAIYAFRALAEHIADRTLAYFGDGNRYAFKIRATPARTGIDLLAQMISGDGFPLIASDIADAIYGTDDYPAPDQHRRELFRVADDAPFYYSDVVGRYQQIMGYGHKPIGDALMIETDEYLPYRPGWYFVTATVPDDWHHVGLMPFQGGWPRRPGERMTGWITEPELRILMNWRNKAGDPIRSKRRSRSLSSVDHVWPLQIHRRIDFSGCSGSDQHSTDRYCAFLDTIGLINVRNMSRAKAGEFLHYAARQIRYHAIGALHPRRQTVKIVSQRENQRLIDDPASGLVNSELLPNGKFQVTLRGEEKTGAVAPQLAAYIWGLSRAYITISALELPIGSLIAIDADAIYSTVPHPSCVPADKAQPGNLRLKGLIKEPVHLPRSWNELAMMQRRAVSTMEYV